ncbi:MAG TPA: FtsX-like permease family protein [Actinoplanes sp.]
MSFGAVRRRTAQAVLVAVLAAILTTAGVAGCWYGLAVASRAAGAVVDAAPAAERVVSVQKDADTGGDPRAALDAFGTQIRGLLTLPGAVPLAGLEADMTYTQGGTNTVGVTTGLPLVYRDDFCGHVRLKGSCPAAAGETAISADVAQRTSLRPGDRIVADPAAGSGAVPLRITAIYTVADPAGVYWTDKLFLSHGDFDPAFTTLDTFGNPALARPTLAYDLPVPLPLLRGDDLYDLNGVLNAAEPRFAAAQLDMANPVGNLFDRVRAQRATVLQHVLIALGQLVVLGWFAIGLAGRFTGRDRRADAGLLKLRGTSSGAILRLATGQHLIPLVVAGVAGLPLGVAGAWIVAGRLPVHSEWWPALLLSVGAAALIVLGSLAALVTADAIAQRAPVVSLLRRVPSARRDWRSGVVDLAFVVLAGGAVYQARTGGPDSGLGVVAPALVALAIGLVLARLLRWIADRAGGAAVRAGRLRAGLTAVQISRQPGTDRAFALITVAVAMVAIAAGGLSAGRAERSDRAQVQLGAPRVLDVKQTTVTALEYAVRQADPSGRYAMAALLDGTSNPPLLAVDSTRLASVATWRPEYGPMNLLGPGELPNPDPLPAITGDAVTVRVNSGRTEDSLLGLTLQNEAGGAVTRLEFQHIRTGEQSVTVPLKGCTTAPGCRLVAFELFTTTDVNGEPVTDPLTIESLTQSGPAATILDSASLGDVRRWRGDFGGLALRLQTAPAGLVARAVVADQSAQVSGTKIYPVDTPLPLPIALAGEPLNDWRFEDAATTRFGGQSVPVTTVDRPRILPVLGTNGILADLDSVRRIAADAQLGGNPQVWLAADAPPGIVDALEKQGLTVVGDRTTAGLAAQWAAQADVVSAPFELFTVLLAVLVAATMVAVVAIVEREPQAEQLRALRVQGLDRRVAVTSAYAGVAALVAAGLVAGLVAALLARSIAAVTAPPFPDHWRLIPPPDPLGPGALGLAAAVAAVVLAVVAVISVRPLVRRMRGTVR